MVKAKRYFFLLLIVSCLVFIGGVVNSQQLPLGRPSSASSVLTNSRQELAKAVLSEVGIAKRYDLYLGNSLGIAIAPETAKKPKFVAWLQGLFVQEAGWKSVEDQYIAQLKTDFSEAELRSLLELAKQPVMQKWMQFEMKSYRDTDQKRKQLLFRLWENYNNLQFTPPPEVLQEMSETAR